MKLQFKSIDLKNTNHVDYTYSLLKQRYMFSNAVVLPGDLPSYKEHKKNLKTAFYDVSIVYYKNIPLGIVGHNKNGSITHNYDFATLRKCLKQIKRKSFELGFSMLCQYIKLRKLTKFYVRINPNNKRALEGFLYMFKTLKTGKLHIDNIQLNLLYE
jgi:hypothetical protein